MKAIACGSLNESDSARRTIDCDVVMNELHLRAYFMWWQNFYAKFQVKSKVYLCTSWVVVEIRLLEYFWFENYNFMEEC